MSKARRPRVVEAERFVLRDAAGRRRAVLEALPGAAGSKSSAVHLVLLDVDGRPALALAVDRRGRPSIHVGPADRGRAVLIARDLIELWRGGNATAALVSHHDGGRLFLHGRGGVLRRVVPRR